MSSSPQPAFVALNIAVLTVSDTRTLADDRSGRVLVDALEGAGHHLRDRMILTDDLARVSRQFGLWIADPHIDVILSTGGTGMTARDITPEALQAHVTKSIPGFGELFRQLSYEEIGTSTIQSRVTGALCGSTFVFALPGSPGACKTAMERILVQQLDNRHRPCNFSELLPRIRG